MMKQTVISTKEDSIKEIQSESQIKEKGIRHRRGEDGRATRDRQGAVGQHVAAQARRVLPGQKYCRASFSPGPGGAGPSVTAVSAPACSPCRLLFTPAPRC